MSFSLERRLHLVLGLILGLTTVLVGLFGYRGLHSLTEAFVLSRLQHDAEVVLGAFRIKGDGRLGIGQRRLTPVYNEPDSGHYFKLQLDNGVVFSSQSLGDGELELRALAPGEETHWQQPGPDGQSLLVYVTGREAMGHRLTLAVAEDIRPLEAQLERFRTLFLTAAFGVLVLLLIAQHWVVHWAFRRLTPVFQDISRLEKGEIVRLTEDVPAEVFPLVSRFNRLLGVLAQHLERSRNAAGNLAHALKGPLNLLLQRIDGPELADQPRLREEMQGQTRRIQSLMERELRRARLAGSGGPGRTFRPAEELPALRELLQRLYRERELVIDCRTSIEGALNLDREDFLELLGNLMDNACKWAASRVECVLEVRDSRCEIRVEDDGPGCTEAELDRISERGVRLDEGVEGHGLGLAIAKDIVKLYGGTLAFDRSLTLGGFRVRVTLSL